MTESTQTPVERLVAAAVEFARACRMLDASITAGDAEPAMVLIASNKLRTHRILLEAARAVGDE